MIRNSNIWKNTIQKTRGLRYKIIKILSPTIYDKIDFSNIRPFIQTLKKLNLKKIVGAEIGVYKGRNAKQILEQLSIKTLYLIDPFKPFIDASTGQLHNSANFNDTKTFLDCFKNQIIFIKKKSDQAFSLIPSLDFVYIDGDHSYEVVKNDIEVYYPKIKPSGFIGGHNFEPRYLGVIKAVSEYALANQLKVHIKKTDWWIKKEK